MSDAKPPRIVVRNTVSDLVRFAAQLRERSATVRSAPADPLSQGPMNTLARRLHPGVQRLRVTSRRRISPTTVTFRIAPADAETAIAPFRAGQYLSVIERVDGTPTSRPFSISCSPDEARKGNFYDITVKANDDGFFAPWALGRWNVDTTILTSGPEGFFTYEPIRDGRRLVFLAGGSGITPFRSLARDTLARHPDVSIALFYGFTRPEEELFGKEWQTLALDWADRFTYTPVSSEPDSAWSGTSGFLTAELIRRTVDRSDDASFFVCGPAAMHHHLKNELASFSLRPGQLRRENFGGRSPDATRQPGTEAYPPGAQTSTSRTEDRSEFSVTVHGTPDNDPVVIQALASETVLVALERAGLNPPALCRSGECGWCRSKLIAGTVESPESSAGLRGADRKFGYFHPCHSWPLSDLIIAVPPNPWKK